MKKTFLTALVIELEAGIRLENRERERERLPGLPRLEITLLGQLSLIVNPAVSERLALEATADFDAWLPSAWESKRILSEALGKFGLRYDHLSRDIWMPEDGTRETLYDSPLVKIEIYSAIDVIVSKARFAPAKNIFLIRSALKLFGAPLMERLTKYGINPESLSNG